MSKPSTGFLAIASELSRVNAQREQLIRESFEALEYREAELAQLVQNHIGTRQRAAIWMASHQRALGGRTPYEALAEDDFDTLWDLVDGSDGNALRERHEASQMA